MADDPTRLHGHERVLCSCGAVIAFCRCRQAADHVRVVERGCQGCRVQLDLGVADVHAPSSSGIVFNGPPNERPSPRTPGQHAAFVIARNDDGEVLCVSRPEPPHEMSLPGGMVEAGESPEAAAAREVKEETGVRVTALRHLRDLTSPTDGRPVHVFEATSWEGDAYAAEPASKVEWLLPSVLFSQATLYRATVAELLKHGDLHAPTHGNQRTMSEHTADAIAADDWTDELFVELISAAKRHSIPKGKFALPEREGYPLDTAKRVRNAPARLEAMKKRGKVTPSEYTRARAAIARAAKKFGIESEYNAADKSAPPARDDRKRVPKSIHVRADLARGGSLHVRHMTDRGFFCAEGVNLTDDAGESEGPVWVQVAKTGTFLGHSAGPFKLDHQVFSEIIHNFKTSLNRQIPADYEHASEADATEGRIPVEGAPAQGWFKDFEIRPDGNLWGLVEWLEPAKSQIKAKKYKYLSPAIRFGTKDRVTGKPTGARLSSVALTNNPFLDGMEPIAAKDTAVAPDSVTLELRSATGSFLDAPVISPHEYMPKLRVALGLHELSTPQECSDRFASLRDMCMSVGPTGQHSGVSMSSYMNALRDVVGAGHGTTWSDMLDTVQDMIDDAMEQHVETMHSAQLTNDGGGDPAITNREETTMADEAHTIALRDAQTKATELATQLKDATTKLTEQGGKVAELSLQLKDAQARAETATTVLAKVAPLGTLLALIGSDGPAILDAAHAEIVRLRDEAAKRAEADMVADVDVAFLTWKDKRGLGDADKAIMLSLARSNREAFHKMFPPVPADQRHLLRVTTPTEPRRPAPTTVSVRDIQRRLMSEKGMQYDPAYDRACRIVRGDEPNPFAGQ